MPELENRDRAQRKRVGGGCESLAASVRQPIIEIIIRDQELVPSRLIGDLLHKKPIFHLNILCDLIVDRGSGASVRSDDPFRVENPSGS